jgi:NAD+ synthase
MTAPLHITLSQLNPTVGNIDYNVEKIINSAAATPDNTDLIIFPEMIVCGYPPEDLVLKPLFIEEVKRGVNLLVESTREHSKYLLVSSPWSIDGKNYNVAQLIGSGKIIATIKKHHLPDYGVFDETRHFKPGGIPDPVTFKGYNLGIMICEDMWKEDVSRNLKDKGADILIAVNASPYETDKNNQRIEHARKRVNETTLPLIYINQCGGQDELVFDGASFILDKHGGLIAQANEFTEDTIDTIWDNEKWSFAGDVIKPVHTEPDAIYQAAMTGLRDYVTKNGFPGVIIGLSGGIDSALSAAIAVDALGSDAVHCVMMPSKFTSQESLDDAGETARALGVKLDNISIEAAVAEFEKILQPHFSKDIPGIVNENIQPRCRGLTLMALSNASGRMVLSTGNKSEMAVGYATLYGDMCGGFNALKDLYKSQVYELSRWRNEFKPENGKGPEGTVIAKNILTKAPTAELKDNQTDQDTLPPYEELDDILYCLIEKDMDIETIVKRGHKQETVYKTWRMLDMAEYKRRQAPPGVKITSRSFGRDRRYPITNHFLKIIEKK